MDEMAKCLQLSGDLTQQEFRKQQRRLISKYIELTAAAKIWTRSNRLLGALNLLYRKVFSLVL